MNKKEFVSEFLGTFILITFGVASVAQQVLSGNNNLLTINIAWGLAVMFGIYISGPSGSHLNPAVTLALAFHKKFPWNKVGQYLGAQFLGAFVASIVVFMVYSEALTAFDGGIRQVTGAKATAGIWATYPQSYLTIFGGIIDQVFGTMLLMLMIFAFGDQKNNPPAKALTPLCVGLVVILIGMTFGLNAGYAINPARDFSPRLFTALFGWGGEVFSAGNGFWWVPLFAPCLGAILAGYVYQSLTKYFTEETQSNEQQNVTFQEA